MIKQSNIAFPSLMFLEETRSMVYADKEMWLTGNPKMTEKIMFKILQKNPLFHKRCFLHNVAVVIRLTL